MPSTVSVCPIGNSINIATSTTVAVANVATGTNTFRFVNGGATVYSYVGVFKDYATAAAAQHPVAGTPGNLMPVAPGDSINVVGNFGISPNPGTVYIAAITNTSTTTTLVTPLAP